MITTSRHAAELDELGYTLLPSWVPADLLAELRATVARLYEIEGEKAGSEFRLEPGCLRLANLVDKAPVFQRVIAAPELLALVEHVIGPDYKLSSLNCRTALPGCAPQPLHADMGGIADERGYWVCNIIWMLDAYTPDNGPLRVVPGSHRWRRLPASDLPDLRASHPAEKLVTAPAGSVVVTNAHVWHGGVANRTNSNRTALHAFYCRRDKPQQQYQKKLLRPEVQATLPPDVRHLLALDDPLNDELANSNIARSGFLPAPERPRAY
ncbi:MAG: phytanoyl-CoA dioxygenase family protein [Opitutaceae bacterium]|nr:phytanoyl-CoA dioxygenase family protein [Opitutaceae bacterium]